MAKLKRKTNIQKSVDFVMDRIAEKFGICPEKLPPLPKRKKMIPAITEPLPSSHKICRQSTQWRRIATNKGVNMKLKFGASSWTATAFPQSLDSTRDVIVVMPDGRYVPAEIPKRNTQHCNQKRFLLKEMAKSAAPTATAEKAIVFLWLIRDDRWPDPNSDMKYHMERKRNSEPALP